MLMVFRVLCACVLMVACFSQSVVARQDPRNVRVFLPPAALIKQQLSLDLENDGIAEAVLVYTIPDKSDDVYHTTGVQVLKSSPVSGWAVAFEETEPKMLTSDDISIEKLRAPTGKEALLVISYYSGAGTATTCICWRLSTIKSQDWIPREKERKSWMPGATWTTATTA